MKKKIVYNLKVTAMGLGYLLSLGAALVGGLCAGSGRILPMFECLGMYIILWIGARNLRISLMEEK